MPHQFRVYRVVLEVLVLHLDLLDVAAVSYARVPALHVYEQLVLAVLEREVPYCEYKAETVLFFEVLPRGVPVRKRTVSRLLPPSPFNMARIGKV